MQAGGISVLNVFAFLVSLAAQIVGAGVLPRTNGFTDPLWTAVSLGCYALAMWVVATLIRQGAPLNIIVPIMSAAVPLATILVAYFAYGQAVTGIKLALLVGACLAVGIAGLL